MDQTMGAVSADLEMMLQLMMEVPLVVAALAARIVMLHMRVAQGRAVALVIRVRAGNGDGSWWRQLIHAGGLLMVHHLLLLLLLLLDRAGRRLLLLLLLAGLPLRLVATLAAGVPETPAVGLILPLPTETAKWRWPFKKRQSVFLREDICFVLKEKTAD